MYEWLPNKGESDDAGESDGGHDHVQLRLGQLVVEHDGAQQVSEDLTARVHGPEDAEVKPLRILSRAPAEVLALRHPEYAAAEPADDGRHDGKYLDEGL